MDFNDIPFRALQIDEVLETILEYVASGELISKSSNLRLVCKQWRDLSFKGLCRSTSLPAISLRRNKISVNGNLMRLATFRKRFPQTCPTDIGLSEPMLPIGMELALPSVFKDAAVIQEFSFYVATVQIKDDFHMNSFERRHVKDNGYNENQIYKFTLVNLRTIEVFWEPSGISEPWAPWHQLLNHILDTSKRVSDVKYIMNNPSNNWPIALPQVNQIALTGSVTDLGRLINPIGKQLVELKLRLANYTEPYHASAECAALTEILEGHSSTLEEVWIIKLYANKPALEVLRLPRSQLRSLRALKTDIPILFESASNLNEMPKLNKLKYVIGYHPAEKSDGLKVSHLASNSLARLDLYWDQSLTLTTDEENESREAAILKELEEESFPVYPELLELNICDVPLRFALALMPKVFRCMTNLTSLRVDFVRQDGPSAPCEADANDLPEMLTGVASADIPKDETLWPDLLNDKPGAITNLKNLSQLEVRICEGRKCVFGGFIFHAAFLPMKQLKLLRVGGDIKVEKQMQNVWKSAGRKIVTGLGLTRRI